MNEKIKQFAIECAGALDWDTPKDPKEYSYTPLELTRFVELIIKECAEVLDENIAPPSHPFNSIGYKLKEHFGIES